MNQLMTLEKIQEELQGRNHAEVARGIGVTSVYIHYIASGERVNPSYEILVRLSKWLQENQK